MPSTANTSDLVPEVGVEPTSSASKAGGLPLADSGLVREVRFELTTTRIQTEHSGLTELFPAGQGDRNRTYDLLNPNQARYLAALHPVGAS